MSGAHSQRVTVIIALSLMTGFAGGAAWYYASGRAASLLDSAREAYADEDFTRALELAGRVLDISPRSLDAFRLRAESAEQLGEWEAAAADYERLAELQSQADEAARAYQQAGRAWMGAMRAREAEARLLESAKISPHRPEPYRLLAQLYSIQGRSDELVQQLLRLIQLGHSTIDDLILLSWDDPFIDDPKRLAGFLEADAEYRLPLLAVARKAMAEDRFEDAGSALRQILASHPGSMEARAVRDFAHRARFARWNRPLVGGVASGSR